MPSDLFWTLGTMKKRCFLGNKQRISFGKHGSWIRLFRIQCGGLSNEFPKMLVSQFLQPLNVTLYGKRKFSDMFKLKILNQGRVYCTVGEGNGNPLQYCCLENPMDGGAWQATVHGVSHEEWDMTERLHFHFSLSCFGERNGNLLQCSCLENPRDRGAWWAAIYGFGQSRTRLKRLSNSSSSILYYPSVVV